MFRARIKHLIYDVSLYREIPAWFVSILRIILLFNAGHEY